MSRGRAQTVNVGEVNALSNDDRIAIAQMVKEGEMNMAEAVQRVKEMSSQKQTGKIGRRGAVKRVRGRLDIEIVVHKGSFASVLLLKIKKGRDLMQVSSSGVTNPYVKAWLSGGEKKLTLAKQKKKTEKRTAVRENTRNPIFDDPPEEFRWEIRTDGDVTSKMMLHIEVETQGTGLIGSRLGRKSLGMMSFPLRQLWQAPSPISGWYKVLDPERGKLHNQPYHAKRKVPAMTPAPLPSAQQPSAAKSMQHRPLPPPPSASVSAPSSRQSDRPPVIPSTLAPAGESTQQPVSTKSSSTSGVATIANDPVKSTHTPPVVVRKVVAKTTSDSFSYLKVLGQGSFGKVLLAEHKHTNEIYAIKVIRKMAVIEDDDIEATMTEQRVLSLSTGCRFLTGLHATFQAPDKLFYVMELIGGGDLMFHIQNDKVFEVKRARHYSAEILLGLWYLHSKGVIYRDLKLDNVMLDEEGHVKIADFGMCKENIFGTATTTTFCGTPGYLAPEIIREKPYGYSVDFWSLGVLMYEMLIGDSPFDADDDDELFKQILSAKLEYPKSLDRAAVDVVERFLIRDPSKRLGCDPKGSAGVKNHAFFSMLNWDDLEAGAVEPPFKPKKTANKKDAVNFDEDFTSEDPAVSPPNLRETRDIDQDLFANFSFATNAFTAALTTDDAVSSSGADTAAASEIGPVLEDQSWYRPQINRVAATEAVRGQPPGTCVVRSSTTQPGCYVLCVAIGAQCPWNAIIAAATLADGTVQYQIHKDKRFQTLVNLVEYYTQNPITKTVNGAPVTLRTETIDTAC